MASRFDDYGRGRADELAPLLPFGAKVRIDGENIRWELRGQIHDQKNFRRVQNPEESRSVLAVDSVAEIVAITRNFSKGLSTIRFKAYGRGLCSSLYRCLGIMLVCALIEHG